MYLIYFKVFVLTLCVWQGKVTGKTVAMFLSRQLQMTFYSIMMTKNMDFVL